MLCDLHLRPSVLDKELLGFQEELSDVWDPPCRKCLVFISEDLYDSSDFKGVYSLLAICVI